MTISNSSTILKADLDAMLSTSLGLVQADNAQLPAGLELNFFFPNLVASTDATRSKSIFVAPCDMLIEVVAVQCADHTAASTVTVDVTWDGEGASFPIQVTGTVGAGITKLSRRLNDNTKTNESKNFSTTARQLYVLRKGATVTVTVTATSVATPSTTQVTLALREFFQREM